MIVSEFNIRYKNFLIDIVMEIFIQSTFTQSTKKHEYIFFSSFLAQYIFQTFQYTA